ncbi:DIP1281 family NlpC/P60 protein [Corynebacterium silvaticum]|uniref:NlpC/P60 family protein n=2 Tax=Corynebacterium silvaticum TaxID=2320431 RepID=A0A7Y4LGL8_9CORY|nr:NlpC/P60 family protein [Corynebacterium silvaticum]ARU46181.2 NlpC/P60 family protein [Corynebacterium silvaticum]MBH5299294.1 C40 family peptidase [Corynebacterium silvaticum]NOM64386.1 hydrolase [Corynebacterium silvaticum]NON69595.1 hydrolase [Corynebacterium silvaticum]UWG99406.1 C40 family peptidase [Corynebacterium silvaticum]
MTNFASRRGYTAGVSALGKARIIVASGVIVACIGSTTPAYAEPVNPSDSEIADANGAVGQAEGKVSGLAASLSTSDSQIASLEMEMGGLREAVNKALVDYHDAQSSAQQARDGVSAARSRLDDTQSEIVNAQKVLDEISRSAYRQGAAPSGVAGVAGKTASEDALDRQTYLRTNAEKQREAVDKLDRLRTEQANEESRLREARNLAEQREKAAESAKATAQQAIDDSSAKLEDNLRKRAELVAHRDEAQRELDAARGNVSHLNNQRNEYKEYKEAEAARKKAEEEAAAAEKARQEAEALAVRAAEEAAAARREAEQRAAAQERAQQTRRDANTASATAAEALIQAAMPDHASLNNSQTGNGLNTVQSPQAVDAVNGDSVLRDLDVVQPETLDTLTKKATAAAGNASRSAKIETVISRAQTYIGTQYAWGGGNASGPTLGIRDGGVADSYGDYNKVGFDCSGLTLYAFAGVGIALPHYSGYQYQKGTKISPSEMERGDLIFYGPNAENHVAIYLGDGTMLEAPQSGSTVRISPVRWSGMSPYAVRLI